MRRVLKYIALYLLGVLVAAPGTRVSSAVECVGEGESECQPVNKWCLDDHEDEWDQCGFTLSSDYEYPQPDSNCKYQWQRSCMQTDTGPRVRPPLNLTPHLTPLNPEQYNLSITWDVPIPASPTGYKIRLYHTGEHFPEECFCLLDQDIKGFSFAPFSFNAATEMMIDVIGLPVYNEPTPSRSTASVNISVPRNCQELSLDPQLCGPPEYGETRNISVRTSWADNSGQEMSLHISWQPPLPLSPSLPNFPLPSVFYVTVWDTQTAFELLCKIPESPCFLVTNTTSVTVQPLNAAKQYYTQVTSYMPCSGVRQQDGGRRGCGKAHSSVIASAPPFYSTTSAVSSATFAITITPSTTLPSSISIKPSQSSTASTSTIIPGSKETISSPPTLTTTSVPIVTNTLIPTAIIELKNSFRSLSFGTPTATPLTETTHSNPLIVAVLGGLVGLGLIIILLLSVAIFIIKKLQRCCHCKDKHTPTPSIELQRAGNQIAIKSQDDKPPAITESVAEGVQVEADDHLAIATSNHISPFVQVPHAPPTCISPYVQMLQTPHSCPSSYVQVPHTPPTCNSSYDIVPVPRAHTPPTCPSPYDIVPVPHVLPRALIVFSPNSPEEEEKCILQFLVKDLRSWGIETSSHVLQSRGSLTGWVVQEFEGAVAILCVCNGSFWQEWEGQNSGRECCVVHALKQLVHGAITQGQDLSDKIAVIKLYQSHFIYIPPILQNCRDYVVSDTDGIAQFVKEQPPYSLTL